LNEIPPTLWRTRIHALEVDFNNDGPMAREIRGIRELETDLEVYAATERFVKRHADLFPGEAGLELALSIVCNSTPQVEYVTGHDQDGQEIVRRPFEDELPPYAPSGYVSGRVFRARRERNPDKNRAVLDQLRGSYGNPPVSQRRAAERLKMSSSEFHKRLENLSKLGVRVRSSEDQKLVAAVFRPWAFALKDERIRAVSRGLSHDRAETMSIDDASTRTGRMLSELIELHHCQVFTQKSLSDPDGEGVQLIRVPPELILFPPVQARDDAASPP
jgi:hypothetical protein